jgi:hypothetical protein
MYDQCRFRHGVACVQDGALSQGEVQISKFRFAHLKKNDLRK